MRYYSGTIGKGSKGYDVKQWQEYLQSQGYDFSEYGGIDGIFGEGTTKFTNDWLKKNGFSESANGIVRKEAWEKAGFKNMNSTVDAPNTTSTMPTAPKLEYINWLDTQGGKEANVERQAAEDKLNEHGDFNYLQQDWMDQVLNDIKNRKEFSYNFNEDALYQQYKDKYIKQGKMAMADTIGQASAMTGGYGNSYAQSVGQQAYQASLENLNDIVPELYQMAYDKYNNETQDLYNQYGLLMEDYKREYGEYSDEYNRLLTALNRADSEFYNGANLHQTEQSMANTVAQNNFQNEFNIWDAQNTEAWNRAQWDEAARQYAYQQYLTENGYTSSGSSSGSSSGGSGGGTGGLSADLGGDTGNTNTTVDFSKIEEKASTMVSNEALGNYVAELEAAGAITPEQSAYLNNAYNNPYEVEPSKDGNGGTWYYREMVESAEGWKVVSKGGGNLWGVDKNAIVITPNGEQLSLKTLRERLEGEGYSTSQANDKIKKLQQDLGISSNWMFGW